MYTDAPLTHTSAAEYEHAKKHPLRPLLLVAVYTDRNTRTLPNHKYISGNMQRTHTHTVHRIILNTHTHASARAHAFRHSPERRQLGKAYKTSAHTWHKPHGTVPVPGARFGPDRSGIGDFLAIYIHIYVENCRMLEHFSTTNTCADISHAYNSCLIG